MERKSHPNPNQFNQSQETYVIGIIDFIDPPLNVSKKEGQEFIVANMGIDTTVSFNGTTYKNYCAVQFKQDYTKILEHLRVGDKIVCYYGINGSFVTKEDKLTPTPNNLQCKQAFVNLNAYKVILLEPVAEATTATTTQNTNAAPNPVQNGAPNGYNPTPENVDDLPF